MTVASAVPYQPGSENSLEIETETEIEIETETVNVHLVQEADHEPHWAGGEAGLRGQPVLLTSIVTSLEHHHVAVRARLTSGIEVAAETVTEIENEIVDVEMMKDLVAEVAHAVVAADETEAEIGIEIGIGSAIGREVGVLRSRGREPIEVGPVRRSEKKIKIGDVIEVEVGRRSVIGNGRGAVLESRNGSRNCSFMGCGA